MTPSATHLSILVGRLSLAETERDIEGQCRALDAILRFITPLKRAATQRAWTAFDQRQKERA